MKTTPQNNSETGQAAELLAAERIAQMCDALEIPAPDSYPLSLKDVLSLVDSLDFRADPDFIAGLINSGQLKITSTENQQKWNPLSVWHLIVLLEVRRRWKPTETHRHKFSTVEWDAAQASEAGEEFITDIDQYDIEHLCLMLEEAEAKELRHVLRVALITKLRTQGAL